MGGNFLNNILEYLPTLSKTNQVMCWHCRPNGLLSAAHLSL